MPAAGTKRVARRLSWLVPLHSTADPEDGAQGVAARLLLAPAELDGHRDRSRVPGRAAAERPLRFSSEAGAPPLRRPLHANEHLRLLGVVGRGVQAGGEAAGSLRRHDRRSEGDGCQQRCDQRKEGSEPPTPHRDGHDAEAGEGTRRGHRRENRDDGCQFRHADQHSARDPQGHRREREPEVRHQTTSRSLRPSNSF